MSNHYKKNHEVDIQCLIPGDFFVNDNTLYAIGEIHSRFDPFRDCFNVNKKEINRFPLNTKVKTVKGLKLYHLLIDEYDLF